MPSLAALRFSAPPTVATPNGGAHRSPPVTLNQRAAVVSAAAAATAATVAVSGAIVMASSERSLPVDGGAVAMQVSGGPRTPEAATAAVVPLTPEAAAAQLDQLDAAALIKAAGLLTKDVAQTVVATLPTCALGRGGFGAVKSWVATAGLGLRCQFGVGTVYGVGPRAGGPDDHPNGLALDFMVDRGKGDALAACALENMNYFNIKYIIWRQRINFGSGWRGMEDRGSTTANHYDHVHISFDPRPGSPSNLIPCT